MFPTESQNLKIKVFSSLATDGQGEVGYRIQTSLKLPMLFLHEAFFHTLTNQKVGTIPILIRNIVNSVCCLGTLS
jgi:hypothetical protein